MLEMFHYCVFVEKIINEGSTTLPLFLLAVSRMLDHSISTYLL